MGTELQVAILGMLVGVIGALVGLIPVMRNYIQRRIEVATSQVQQTAVNQQSDFQTKMDQSAAIVDSMRVSNENVTRLIAQLGRMVDGLEGIEKKGDSTETAIDRFDDTLSSLLNVGSQPVQRIDSNVAAVVLQIEAVKDIAVAAADQGETNQEVILEALRKTEDTLVRTINHAINQVKDSIEKRKTSSQPIVTVAPEPVNEPIKE